MVTFINWLKDKKQMRAMEKMVGKWRQIKKGQFADEIKAFKVTVLNNSAKLELSAKSCRRTL